eukprot:scaffold269663_cov37-Tisochrysis_lutea.AAC.1
MSGNLFMYIDRALCAFQGDFLSVFGFVSLRPGLAQIFADFGTKDEKYVDRKSVRAFTDHHYSRST